MTITEREAVRRIVRASGAKARLDAVAEWLRARRPSDELLVVVPNRLAGDELLRSAALSRRALFGWRRETLPRIAARLAEVRLADEGRTIASPLAIEAVTERAIARVGEAGALARYASVCDGPGFARAVARTLLELRMNQVSPDRLDDQAPELAAIARAYDANLIEAGLADRAAAFEIAVEIVERDAATEQPIGLPLAALDVDASTALEHRLLAALGRRAEAAIAALPAADPLAEALAASWGGSVEDIDPAPKRPLHRLQRELFSRSEAERRDAGDDVSLLSAPGENREAVEIARGILRLAERGTAFDRVAVALRAPEAYRAHLQEAFERARIPAYFAPGTMRPHAAGRALIALLQCAREGLSARRFSEYLSIGELPEPDTDGGPPPPDPREFAPPDHEMARDAVPDGGEPDAEEAAPLAPNLRAPRHWERLLLDAAVIGGADRWKRRLSGLAHELRLDLEWYEREDDPAADRTRRDLEALSELEAFALPLLADLAALSGSHTWAYWLERIAALATRALRRPERVLALLAEMSPFLDWGSAGAPEVELDEVLRVLSPRLLEIRDAPPKSRMGRVFVAPIEQLRGMSFEVVFVPGLAERIFPPRIDEDPILRDSARAAVDDRLATNDTRVDTERARLAIACGAAEARVVLSYPRLDIEHARPRVPSFYALEAIRAAEGELPSHDDLARRAERAASARLGWPAPRRPEEAIDEAEFDLAVLSELSSQDEEQARGAARYLIQANDNLARALRFRARRWLKSWTSADGLVFPQKEAVRAMIGHQLDLRSFSPTALQQFAACPYRFYLYAIWRLSPREVPEAIEELDPLQRGSMVHDVQFALFTRLRDEGLLPVVPDRLEAARAVLDQELDRIAARYEDDLAPAIERVFRDAIEGIKADLREWLRRMAEDDSGFVPWKFELSFGLGDRRDADPDSTPDDVLLDCGLRLRGSIDLVEKSEDGRARVTDHKTGKVRVKPDQRIAGGESLQAVLYPLAVEKLHPDLHVVLGRLYYCTAAGGFEERAVPLDDAARKAAKTCASAIGQHLSEPFLPALPTEGACRYCDYRVVCGPYEERRTAAKPRVPVLETLRSER